MDKYKLKLKSPLLERNTVGFHSSREVQDKQDLSFPFRNKGVFSVGAFYPVLMVVSCPSTLHHHILGILWLCGTSAGGKRARNQVYPTSKSMVSPTKNDMPWTKSK